MKTILTLFICLLSFSVFCAETINLTSQNHVLLRGQVTPDSVATIITDILKLSAVLPETQPIYLVIDSGGGSVFDGIDLLGVMEIIPQPIHTVSIFAFSMAYSISQRGDKRYIAQRGIMGQHRAVGTFQGQFGFGEVEQRLKIMTKVILDLERYEADKMGISLPKFQMLIKDEMYVYYTDAIENKVADEQAKLTCSRKLLQGRKKVKKCSMFGCVELDFSTCPLIRGVLPEIKNEQTKEEVK